MDGNRRGANKMKISDKAKALAYHTSGAYSYDAYKNWDAVIQMCLDLGYSEMETEAIVRSKWTRWACDSDTNRGGRYGYHTSNALKRFLVGTPKKEVNDLVFETFGFTE